MITNRKSKILLVTFLIALFLFSEANGMPEKIVSLAPSVTESLYYLGAEELIVGITSYCNYPEDKKIEVVGSLTNLNLEKIYSLSPDLVLTVEGVNRPQTIENLRELGLDIIVLDESNDFQGVLDNFMRVGKLIGKEDKAEEIVRDITKRVNLIVERLKGLPPVRVFWEVGARPLYTVSGKSFANEFITFSGGVNIFADAPVRYPLISREEVLRRNPQVIILVTMGNVTRDEKFYWKGFKDLDAARFDRIYIVDADKVCQPTPMAFLIGLEEVARIIHPEAFDLERVDLE